MRFVKIAIVVLSLAGCASGPVGESSETASQTEQAALSLYKAKCRNCHNLIEPSDHSATEWPEIMAAHRVKRVRLSDAEADRIVDYLKGGN